MVGFLYNNNPAYIQFSKNPKGNYEWNYIEKSEGQSFAQFLVNVRNNESTCLKFMIVTNQGNDIAKIELGVNEQVIVQGFNVNQNSVSWIDLPESESLTFTYKYFDKNGNRIDDN